MALEVRPVTEDEINTFTLLAIESFQSGIGHLLTGPNTPENVARKNANSLKSFRENPNSHFFQVVDTSTGEMIAGAHWYVFSKGNTEQELDKIFERATPEQGYRQDWEPIYAHLADNRRKIMGTRPYIYLNMLFTSPKHHRRGAGALLVSWGTKKADELGLECYLEGSKEGRVLYERFGFKVLEATEFDMSKYGRPELGVDVNCIMYREAPHIEKSSA